MYVSTNYRGLGTLQDLAPDDPALQTTPEDIAGTTYGATTGGAYPYASVAPASQSLTGWLNANAKTVGIGAAVFVGLMLLMGGRR